MTNVDPSNLNRETRRRARAQGLLDAEGNPTRRAAPAPAAMRPTGPKERFPKRFVSFFRESSAELRKVVWPTKAEVRMYAIVTMLTLMFMILFVFALDYVFSSVSIWLFK